ncbi:MAG: glutamate--tRNA ligase family protein [Candidatus Parcubacteria bacterium]|nr:glutamate--tRNA ligase family protein [Candidatus Parcubacteria bacterium]
MTEKKVVTRFAPSPTGSLHLGNFRTAIFAYLYAKKHNGVFVFRIEDTDKERSKKEYEDEIVEGLKWLGLSYDKFYRQSENLDRHKFFLEKMISEGNAFLSKEEAKDGSGVIKELIRFKNPNIDVTFKDEIKGEVTMNTKDLGDFVIAKNINEPLFHLAVVVDDFEESVTHVIRGEDHVSNTARQILIQRAIGAETPIYAHMPLVLDSDKLKLSKRRGALPILEYRKRGFLPEAILNAVAFVGWNPGTAKEIYTHDELVRDFDMTRVQKSPAILNEEKLEWFNKEHIKLLSLTEIEKNILEYLPEDMRNPKLVPVILERISKWSDVKDMAENGELDCFFKTPEINKEKLIYKNTLIEKITENLKLAIEKLKEINEEDFSEENIKNVLMSIANGFESRGELLHPVRYALSGKDQSPNPFIIASIIGKNETLSRLQKAIE